METDHIIPGGSDTIDNAIAVCFECHAEIHSYNDNHPRGRKFHADELKKHKEQWLVICKERPEALISVLRNADVGPLQALIDELEFNENVAQYSSYQVHGCLFQTEQFLRGIREGVVAILDKALKKDLLDAYVAIGRANQHILSSMAQDPTRFSAAEATNRASESIIKAKSKIEAARKTLLGFLSTKNA